MVKLTYWRVGPAEQDLALLDEVVMFYVYVLKSEVNGDIYVGYSSDLKRRFKEHNEGESKFTKGYRPWTLIYYEAYRIREDATKREVELKGHRAKEFLKEHIKESLNI